MLLQVGIKNWLKIAIPLQTQQEEKYDGQQRDLETAELYFGQLRMNF